MIINVISAFVATVGFSIVFNVHKKHLVICGITGAIGWWIYLIVSRLGYSAVLAIFLATLVVAQFSYVLAKRRRAPVTVFLISGIIPLVPGVGLYRTMYALLFSNYRQSLEYALLTFQMAGVIAIAIMVVSLVPLLWRPNKRPFNKNKTLPK